MTINNPRVAKMEQALAERNLKCESAVVDLHKDDSPKITVTVISNDDAEAIGFVMDIDTGDSTIGTFIDAEDIKSILLMGAFDWNEDLNKLLDEKLGEL